MLIAEIGRWSDSAFVCLETKDAKKLSLPSCNPMFTSSLLLVQLDINIGIIKDPTFIEYT